MLDPVHNQGLRLCLGAVRTSVESLYVNAHGPSLGARRAKLSLQYASKIKWKYRDYIRVYTDGSRNGNYVVCASFSIKHCSFHDIA